mgnify:CR=1 FL=1
MPSPHAILGLTALLLACACSGPGNEPSPRPGPEGQGQPAADQAGPPPGEGGAEPPPVVVSKPTELFLGEWVLELNPTQQRQYELLQLAFHDPPPTEQELEAMELGPEEQLMIGMVLMGREQHPDDAATPDVQRGLDELASATLTVTADSLSFSHGEERDQASYTVNSEEDATLVLETTTTVEGQPVVEFVNVRFDGIDRLLIWAEGDPSEVRQSFTRRGATPSEQDEKGADTGSVPKNDQPKGGGVPGQTPPADTPDRAKFPGAPAPAGG